ncbi:S-layer homology domain-containing protein [Selenomonas ruminantium]|uniref:S-layer homology domain-containing protein n=1 Tax=Selenomonas ruminantium TaxID=971 RepID=A0A1M6TVB3_SELRU|nr:S-layer homology domain-containing protein [Selenomonas ruminantium]SHK60952.1 S-layer homology domain-containing protein [Selenomonas ruminantium]
MNKKLVSAMTTALVVGAASTTFAASNPFSDVPAGHWAYDAVNELVEKGVLNGYGDGTFRGDRNITRYEMAKAVAKAMAQNPTGEDKVIVDKLRAEFADELNNLGVRVSDLERNADKVQWHGTAEYTFQHYMTEGANDHENGKDSRNNLLIRLEPNAEVNEHWHVKARLDANTFLDDDSAAAAEDNGNVNLKRVFAEGNYGDWTLKFGKFATPDDDTIADTAYSGAEVAYKPAGDGISAVVGAGRLNSPALLNRDVNNVATANAANYQYVGAGLQKSKFWGALRWHHLNGNRFEGAGYGKYAKSATKEANVILAKGGYKFDNNWAVKGFYAQNHDADYFNKAGSAEIDYKGAQAENAGSWGAWVAYRHLGRNAFISSPWDVINIDNMGEKGFEVGGNCAVFKNTILTLRYGKGKDLQTSKKVQNLFARVNFLF